MSSPLSIAFIGIGVMGRSMAGHLLRAGHRLHVHNRTPAKAAELLAAGATWHDGSWWTDWQYWIGGLNDNEKVAARGPGDGQLAPIEDAPGSYATLRIGEARTGAVEQTEAASGAAAPNPALAKGRPSRRKTAKSAVKSKTAGPS